MRLSPFRFAGFGLPLLRASAAPAGSALLLAAVLVGIGTGLRLVLFLTNNSVNTDEARFAVNVLSRSYLGLFPPLDHDQSAPVLFLWAIKACTRMFGPGELALRAVPLVSGIGLVLLAYPTFHRQLGRTGAAVATGFLAVSAGLVQYSAIAKQYGLEAFVTLALLTLTFDVVDRARVGSQNWLLAAGVVAPWAAAPSGFVLIAIIAALAMNRPAAGRQDFRLPLTAATLWGASCILAYALVYHHASANPSMQRFWEPAFLTLENPEAPSQFFRVVRGLLWGGLPEEISASSGRTIQAALVHFTTLGLVAHAVVGLVAIYRHRGISTMVLVGGPLVLVTGAAVVGAYPFSRRLLLFTMPLLAILLGSGVSVTLSRTRDARRRVAYALAMALIFLPPFIMGCLAAVAKSPPTRPLIQVQAQRRQAEPIYVSTASIPEWIYYSTDWSVPDRARLAILNRVSSPGGPSFENAPSRGSVPGGTGDALVWSSSGGDELLGLATGIEFRAGQDYPGTPLDQGWLANESARIRAAATPGIWVLLRAPHGPEAELFDALQALGGRRSAESAVPGVTLARFEFR